MSDQRSTECSSDQQVTFLIKNPSKHDDSYALSVPLEASIADIQRKIAEEYEGKPSPSSQTLIYAGKVLKDPNLRVKDIMKQPVEPDVPHSMHLVVRAPISKPISAPTLPSSSSSGTLTASRAAQSSLNTGQPSAGAATATNASTGSTSASSPPQTAAQLNSSSADSDTRAGVGASVSGMANGAAAQMYEFGTSSQPSLPSSTAAHAVASAGLPATSIGMPYPYMFLNPVNVSPVMSNQVMATAYQAAYSAALYSMRHQMGMPTATAAGESSSSSAAPVASTAPHMLPLTAPLTPAVLYYPAAYQQAAAAAAMAAAAAAQHGQPGLGAVAAPAAQPQFAMPAPFAVPVMGMPTAMTGHPAAAAADHHGAAAGADVAPAGRAGLRQRLPHRFSLGRGQPGVNAAAMGRNQQDAAAQPGADQGHAHGHRRYRTRTITFRISMRTLLQMLVFGMVLYQHCTWPRLCILLAGSVILYATALWAPFRQFILSLAMPPRPEQLAEMHQRRQQQQQQAAAQYQLQAAAREAAAAAAARPPVNAAQQQPVQGAAAGAEAGGAAAAAPAAPAAAQGIQQPGIPAWLQQGIVREILTVVVSFVTSLLPAWNYNPEDAAVFAAAQEMMAREAREQQQQQRGGGNQQAENGGGAAADEAAAAAAP